MTSFNNLVGSAFKVAVVLGSVAVAACDDGYYGFGDSRLTDAAEKSHDIGQYFMVARGDQVAADQGVASEGGPLGASSSVSVSVQVHGINTVTPEIGATSLVTDQSTPTTNVPTSTSRTASVSLDGAVRVLKGVGSGTARALGVDVIGGVTHLPDPAPNGWSARAASPWSVDLGLRLGVISETATSPGIAFTIMHHWVPMAAYSASGLATTGGGLMEMDINALDVGVNSWRVTASKVIGRFGINAGLGVDHYSGSYTYSASLVQDGETVNGSDAETAGVSRTNLSLGAWYRIGRIRVTGEFGHQTGGSLIYYTATSFDAPTGKVSGRSYFSAGARITP
ncbi:MAG: hypothetical protein ACREL5_02920 [Gemmatimonadales bacterium]